ncbi:tubulin polyglutamylase TTLL11-like isoform X2 [Corticium candelabrum]|uniref:tubulin polyglutamylase TTLL11-like isoform X2 n=1 Tax=Corticium candelabrum TaxID=121492 RepID=UPI002E265BF8|nr:tubulin polyglutamylase TTLL11-like isoform X2 [Corticium candelabrum]
MLQTEGSTCSFNEEKAAVHEVSSKESHTKRKSRKRVTTINTSNARSVIDVLQLCIKELGWKNVIDSHSHCDLYWYGLECTDQGVLAESRVNRFPGMRKVAHKVQLGRLLKQMYDLFPEEYDFFPQTWSIPHQQDNFTAYALSPQSLSKETVFIIKPDDGSQGEGIRLFQKPRDLSMGGVLKDSIVQEYISRPMLIDGLKFDLRLYVLLMSVDPLQVYIVREGLARFCTESYKKPTAKNLHKTFMHLTNYSLNKRSASYVHTEDGDHGSKRLVSVVFQELADKGYDIDILWSKIDALVCKTVIAMKPMLLLEMSTVVSNEAKPLCFQVLGFDVLITDDLKPILLEVNANPSLRIDYEKEISPGVHKTIPSPLDAQIKKPVVLNALQLARQLKRDSHGGLTVADDSTCVELLPATADEYAGLDLLEYCQKLFTHFVGVRKITKMGSSAFRTFVRKCQLSSESITGASTDILYIEISRQHGCEKNSLTLEGFCDALLAIANKLYGKEATQRERLSRLLQHCLQYVLTS